MKTWLLAIGAVFLSISGKAQQEFPSNLWHQGKLVLANEDTLIGKIKYDLAKMVVQIDQQGKILTFGSKSIFYFKIYDATVEADREFYVLPYGLVSNYKTPVIFEVLVEGNLSLLTREYITTKNIQNPYGYGSYPREVLEFNYYFLDRSGEIVQYNKKKRELLDAVAKRRPQVEEYMKANRLRFDRRNDLIRIIAFYNALM